MNDKLKKFGYRYVGEEEAEGVFYIEFDKIIYPRGSSKTILPQIIDIHFVLSPQAEVYFYCTTFPVFGAGELRAFADFMDWLRRNKINKMKLSKNPSNEVN